VSSPDHDSSLDLWPRLVPHSGQSTDSTHSDLGESQKAFNLLQKRLKPLEHYQPVPYDFYNLCYLTSAGTVHDAPGMKDWGGAGPERESLVSLWRELTDGVSGTEGEEQAESD
jgi:hypothetical protein